MASKKRRIARRKIKGKKHRHALFIIFLIVVATFFLHKEFSKDSFQQKKDLRSKIAKPAQPEEKQGTLPKVAVVIDDLGSSKKAAIKALRINAPITLSILPQETYSRWIAVQGHGLGHDVIGHIPMEAIKPHKLGKGGLYTWMDEDEILATLEEDFNSIPHIKGISNHMGSAFTKDERAMSVVISWVNEHGLFFLDSLTVSGSAGIRLAQEKGVRAIKRDIYLDNNDSPEYLEAQWNKLVKIAGERGYAIALAHPGENTIEFLKKAIPVSKIKVVPLSELVIIP